jgi:hypothetical protein
VEAPLNLTVPNPMRTLCSFLRLSPSGNAQTPPPDAPAPTLAPVRKSIRIALPSDHGGAARRKRIRTSLGPGIDFSLLFEHASQNGVAALETLNCWREALVSELRSASAMRALPAARVHIPGKSPMDRSAPARGQFGQASGHLVLRPTEPSSVNPSIVLEGLPSITDTGIVATQISSDIPLSQFGLAAEGSEGLRLVDVIHATRGNRSMGNEASAQAWTPLRWDSIETAKPPKDLSRVQVVMQVLFVPVEFADTALLQFDCTGRHINSPADVTALGSSVQFRSGHREQPVILLPLSEVMHSGTDTQTVAFLAQRQRSSVFSGPFSDPASELHLIRVVLVDHVPNQTPQPASANRLATLKDAVAYLHAMADRITARQR